MAAIARTSVASPVRIANHPTTIKMRASVAIRLASQVGSATVAERREPPGPACLPVQTPEGSRPAATSGTDFGELLRLQVTQRFLQEIRNVSPHPIRDRIAFRRHGFELVDQRCGPIVEFVDGTEG
jgi:hypothetical protein